MYHVEIDGPKWTRFGSPFATIASAYCMAKNCADKPNMYGKTRVIDDDGNIHRNFPLVDGQHGSDLLDKSAASSCCKEQKANGVIPHDYTIEELFSPGVVKTATMVAQLQDWINFRSLDVVLELRLRPGMCSIYANEQIICCVKQNGPEFCLSQLKHDIMFVLGNNDSPIDNRS